jgi:hypothetical protein
MERLPRGYEDEQSAIYLMRSPGCDRGARRHRRLWLHYPDVACRFVAAYCAPPRQPMSRRCWCPMANDRMAPGHRVGVAGVGVTVRMRTIALPASRRRTMFAACVATIVLATLQLCGFTRTVQAETVVCNNAPLPQQAIRLGGPSHSPSQPDLLVNGPCGVPPGVYYFGNVNIVDGGRITFQERSYSRTQFWAGAIIVENGGALTAGSAAAPFGVQGGSVTIVLYGADKSHGDPDHNPGQGAPCRSPLDPMRDVGPCGIP